MDAVPPRPTWVTAIMVAVGIVGAPAAILALALMVGGAALDEDVAVGIGYGSFLAGSFVVTAVRAVRPLGVGMVAGALALALMFLIQGGTSG